MVAFRVWLRMFFVYNCEWLGELIVSQEIFSVEFEIQVLISHWS